MNLTESLRQHMKSGWHPSTPEERHAANLFHNLLHATDLSLPDNRRPAMPMMESHEYACFQSFGSAAGFRELTAETVLEAREAFVKDLVGR